MALCSAAVRLPTGADQHKTRAESKRFRIPSCTHTDMDRVYGSEQICDVCWRSPEMEFLYECRQDHKVEWLSNQLPMGMDDKGKTNKSGLRQKLEAIGLSESIILTAEQGHYTHTQISKLMEMKSACMQVIEDVGQQKSLAKAAAKLTAIMNKKDSALSSTRKKVRRMKRMPGMETVSVPKMYGERNSQDSQAIETCHFRACHSCRPYYRDRIFISIEAVLAGHFAPITQEETKGLPIEPPYLMRDIGTTPSTILTPASQASSTSHHNTGSTSSTSSNPGTIRTSQTDTEDISTRSRSRRKLFKVRRRSRDMDIDVFRFSPLLSSKSLKATVQGIFRSSKTSTASSSNLTLPLSRMGLTRSLGEKRYADDFEIVVPRRVHSEAELYEMKDMHSNCYDKDQEDDVSVPTTRLPEGRAAW